MKYVVTGSAGHVSKPLTEKLLQAGHEVVVVGRNAEHLKPLTDKGAKAAIGSIEDVDFLKKAFAGADAVYLMFPPQYGNMDIDMYRQTANKYAEAIKANNVQYAVMLSSVGAQWPDGCGPVSGLHLAEEELNKLDGVNVLSLRPGFFYLNFFGNVGMIKHMNIIGANYGDSSSKMILSHPNDVAEAAAEVLLSLSFKGHVVKNLMSDETTTGEVAKTLGSAIGNPGLPWVEFNDEQSLEGMTQAGVPQLMATRYVEMGSAIRSGKFWQDHIDHKPQPLGKTKLQDFAKEFAAVYNAS